MAFISRVRMDSRPYRCTRVLLGFLLGMIALGQQTEAAVFVDSSATGLNDGSGWSDAFIDLQDGLDAAAASGGSETEVWVATGTYRPDRGTGIRSSTFQLLSGVALYGGFDGTETVLRQRDPAANITILSGDLAENDESSFTNNGENSYNVVTGSGVDATAILDGFTITAGNADGSVEPSNSGGGMYNNNGSPIVRNCVFKWNTSLFSGGAMYNQSSSSPLVEDCQFLGNTSLDGGAVTIATSSNPSFLDCEFDGNDGTLLGRGGALFITSSLPVQLERCNFSKNGSGRGGAVFHQGLATPNLVDCTFSFNTAFASALPGSGDGGAIYIDGASPHLSGCEFAENDALVGNGGAIYMQLGSQPRLMSCTFQSNRANSGDGGAIYSIDSNPNLSDCNLSENKAVKGGAIFVQSGESEFLDCTFIDNESSMLLPQTIADGGAIYGDDATLRLVGCSLLGNTATDGRGGGIHIENGSDLRLTNSIFVGNAAPTSAGGAISSVDSSPALLSCSLTLNSAANTGGVSGTGSGTTAIANTILWGNSDTAGGGVVLAQLAHSSPSSITVSFSSGQGWIPSGQNWGIGDLVGSGNTSDDPLFVDADGADNIPGSSDDDVQLMPASTLLNAGSNTLVPPDELDIGGCANFS